MRFATLMLCVLACVLPANAKSPGHAKAATHSKAVAPKAVTAPEPVLAPGTVFRDCANVCPEMVVIPPGEFAMGPPVREGERGQAPHPVKITYTFDVGKYLVTRDEYAQFVNETQRPDPESCNEQLEKGSFGSTGWSVVKGGSWHSPGFEQTGRDPVVCVNWNDARAYAEWLSKKTGKHYRLLSESEWEYAARAGTTTARPWGDEISFRDANFASSYGWGTKVRQMHDPWERTSPGGSFPANKFGLYDMLGNAMEWLADCSNASYGVHPFDHLTHSSPEDGSPWLAGSCSMRILRGGSWAEHPDDLTSAKRSSSYLSVRTAAFGFRVARSRAPAPVAYAPRTVFRDCADGCPEMVAIPPGAFKMGSPKAENKNFNEEALHDVNIQYAFAVGKFDVTRAEFARFVAETHYVPKPEAGSLLCLQWNNTLFEDGLLKDDIAKGLYPANKTWDDPGFPQTDRDPVVCIQNGDVRAYLIWLNKKTGKQYRLLSESEWEYAARAGTTTARYWGDQISRDNANYGADDTGAPFAQGADQWEYTSPVGSFAPNGFGLYDMLGNVAQIVEDCYRPNYWVTDYSTNVYGETTSAPNDGTPWGAVLCDRLVTRGGGWFNRPGSIRSGARRYQPWVLRMPTIGFRVARTLD